MKKDLLIFELGAGRFSLPLEQVEEVVPSTPITQIPDSPPFLLGLAAIRGKVMGVIDAALRYGLGEGKNSHFMICRVRGNLTAIGIDRPMVAGSVAVRELGHAEFASLRNGSGVGEKFLRGGFELLEAREGSGEETATGIFFLEVETDLFVSTEMASQIGEA